jgi:hypothetical protein
MNLHPAPPAPPPATGIPAWIWVALVVSVALAWGLALASRR